MNTDTLIAANRYRDLFIVLPQRDPGKPANWTDNRMVVLVPRGWCDDFCVATGFSGGPDYIDEDTEEPSPELYGYGWTGPNTTATGYDTIFWKIADLLAGQEVTEVVAKQIDPGLFGHLDKINRGEI